ncbi:amino acid/amide ABC transporter membrane protein 2 (HAAT family) [Stella humosa]|uniref:Amino acid/amide ABC transporter membrane protein 2 (HAAT family) n=1 Tax=Stella humosa TaxID=94 RepID=A0A3N1L3M2_9PROT|nr:branched-chain amino acid ABC transporter permease [Stella humosa]ROP84005.1 amino acid/amide ABC transporter membrane protein 2 (HAAT family) [Stella humosa]BBK33514.1 ABC transporter ATP-binding protein [Stella humosa]
MSRPAPAIIGSVAALALLVLAPALLLAVLPVNQAQFWTANILGRALVFGIVAMSLTFLATYGGFVSLAQMTVAGIAGYTVAIFVQGAVPTIVGGFGYPAAIALGLAAATVSGALVGAIAVRTRDIYLLMITLALAMGVFRFIETNITWFNGYEGIRNVVGPEMFGLPFRNTYVFYYSALGTAALLYAFVLYLVRSPFGLVLQGIRDNPRRVAALGYDVALHRIASFAVAGFVAGCGGVLATFYNIGISPGSIGLGATVNILIISVVGGLWHPIGAFVGALVFAVFDTFAATIYDRNRFNTLIGVVFLAIVLVSPDGLSGLVRRIAGLLHNTVPTGSRRR